MPKVLITVLLFFLLYTSLHFEIQTLEIINVSICTVNIQRLLETATGPMSTVYLSVINIPSLSKMLKSSW